MDDLILKIGNLNLNENNNMIDDIVNDMKNLNINNFKNTNDNSNIDLDELTNKIKNIKINEIENKKVIEINDNSGKKYIFLLNDKLEYLKYNPPFVPLYVNAF